MFGYAFYGVRVESLLRLVLELGQTVQKSTVELFKCRLAWNWNIPFLVPCEHSPFTILSLELNNLRLFIIDVSFKNHNLTLPLFFLTALEILLHSNISHLWPQEWVKLHVYLLIHLKSNVHRFFSFQTLTWG